ncbi:unnamed protein product, partial [Owenia fusiformis]
KLNKAASINRLNQGRTVGPNRIGPNLNRRNPNDPSNPLVQKNSQSNLNQQSCENIFTREITKTKTNPKMKIKGNDFFQNCNEKDHRLTQTNVYQIFVTVFSCKVLEHTTIPFTSHFGSCWCILDKPFDHTQSSATAREGKLVL